MERQLDFGVILEISAHAREVANHIHPERAELLRGANPGAHEQRGTEERATRDDGLSGHDDLGSRSRAQPYAAHAPILDH
jgi:hypothetical protein